MPEGRSRGRRGHGGSDRGNGRRRHGPPMEARPPLPVDEFVYDDNFTPPPDSALHVRIDQERRHNRGT